jgi:tetratricopeptide (TPR) repeat protein
LILAAVDRHLVSSAGVFLESPTVICLAPWTILLMRRCLQFGAARDWLLLGLLFGLGFWLSTLFLVMLLPLAMYILATGRVKQVLASPWMYAGVGLLILIMLPPLIADLGDGAGNLDRNTAKVGSLGVSPRGLLLYVGDLMMCLKDPLWIIESMSVDMYSPVYVPCFWVIGSIYLVLATAALRFWRDEGVLLLILVLVGVMIPVTLLDAREPWNEFTWASSTVYVVILLAAMVLGRLWSARLGKIAASAIMVYSAATTLLFLGGPKWGYFCPDWQRAYIGQHFALGCQTDWNPHRFPRAEAREAARKLADRVIDRHPDCAIAWFFRSQCARTAEEQRFALQQVLSLDPTNRLVLQQEVHNLIVRKNWAGAKRGLMQLAGLGDASFRFYSMLAEVEYRLGNFGVAAAAALRALEIKPDDSQPYGVLCLAHEALGDAEKSEEVRKRYAALHPAGAAEAYLSLAGELIARGALRRGRELLEAAIRTTPLSADQHIRAGVLFSVKLNELDRAIEHFQAAEQLVPAHSGVFQNLGYAMELKGDAVRAIEYYRKSVRTDPANAQAHLRLGILLAGQNRLEEAGRHLEHAKRLGLTVPDFDEDTATDDVP